MKSLIVTSLFLKAPATTGAFTIVKAGCHDAARAFPWLDQDTVPIREHKTVFHSLWKTVYTAAICGLHREPPKRQRAPLAIINASRYY